MFESYVRNTFREALRDDKIAVLDGNATKHQEPLFFDNKRFPIKPDLIFRKQKVVLGIGEVKYKPKIEESDRYQVISHVLAIGAPIGVWVSPAPVAANAGVEYVGKVSTGAKFYHYQLDISGELDAAAEVMADEVSALL